MYQTQPSRILIWTVVLATILPASLHAESTHARLPAALDELRVTAESHPNNPAGWNDYGNILSLAGRTDEAEESYRRALSVAPDHPSALFNLAILLQEEHRWNDSADQLRRLLKLEPTHARAHYHLGIAQAEKGKAKRAVESFALAFIHEPSLMDPTVNPHIIDNPLYQRASISAHRYLSTGADTPRVYDNPSETIRLFESDKESAGEETVPLPATGEEKLPVPLEPDPDDS